MTGEIIRKQKEFFLSGKTLSVEYRKKYLSSLRKNILSMGDMIAAALREDLGKCRAEAYMTETGMCLSELSHALKNIRRWSRPRKVHTAPAQFPARSRIIPEAYGNVLIMSPWNYPFLLCISPLVSAIAAGNTAVIKPSAYAPATSAAVRELISRTFPEEYVTVIEGGRDVNTDLLEQKFDYIFFTGSKNVGRTVMEKASAHLTPVTLELGGKSPVIVTPSADITVSAARIVSGKFLNCGQTCVAPDYILVHESVAGRFTGACITKIREMYGERPLENPDYGKIISIKHFKRLENILHECATDEGHGASGHADRCHMVAGGETDEGALRIAPAIIRLGDISDPEWDRLKIMQEEIFGPLMPMLTYRDMDDAINYIRSHPEPLATYIFTKDRTEKKRLLTCLRFGGGCINDTIIHLASGKLPFGGTGESGMGQYHGKYGFETFSHLKSIVDKPFFPDIPIRYQPYTAFKERLIKMFMK